MVCARVGLVVTGAVLAVLEMTEIWLPSFVAGIGIAGVTGLLGREAIDDFDAE